VSLSEPRLDPAAPPVPSRRGPAALAAAIRPSQWVKNGVVLAPLVFALRLTDAWSVARALVAVLAFCALASAGYLVNDVVDRERDRHHPEKRRRPVAAGDLAPRAALAAAVVLGAFGLAACASLGPAVLGFGLVYLAIQALYSRLLKHHAIVDVFAVAAGFLVRVLAGAAAIDVPVSSWLYLCTLLLALFLALEKRRAELALLGADAAAHRRALDGYTLGLLDQLVGIVCACTLVAYALYTLAPETQQKFGGERLVLTIPFVLFGIFRYLFLVHRRGEGGQPERVLLRDRMLQCDILLWLAVVTWAIYTRP
jgi:4-hydroxybenzoate polyprenyltransferase